MGNQIGTEACSVEEISKCASGSSNDYSKPAVKPKYGSIIRMWRYYLDPNDDLFVHCDSLDLREFSHFQDESCYIVLHMFLSPELQPPQSPKKTDNEPVSPNSKLHLSAAEIGVSAKQQLSPRGQRNSFGGIHSIAKSLQQPELNKNPVNYDIYIWHGKEVPPHAKANALAKGFEMDETLKQIPCNCILPSFYGENGKITAISSFLQLDHDSLEEWKRQSENNHLFLWISKLYFPSTLKQSSSPPTTKRTKKNRATLLKNSVGNTSHASLPSSPAGSSNKRIRKLSRKHLKGTDHKTRSSSRGQVGPGVENSPTQKKSPMSKLSLQDRLNFRSISLPASEINRVAKLAEGLDGGLKIDLSELPKRETPTAQRVAPPESKASKIARCDKICSQITDSLFLGSDTIARNKEILNENGVTHVLNCAGTICPDYHPNDFIYKKLYLCDGSKEDISSLFYDVLEFVDGAISSGGKVFVHCHQGISRSSAMLILYLMWKDNTDYQSTHERVKAIRAVTNPNAGFTCQLLNWSATRNAPKKKKRIFAVFPHCLKAPDQYILKELPKEHFAIEKLDPRGCFVIWTSKRLFLWIGKDCSPVLVEQGNRYAERLQKYENAPKHRIEKQGQESARFVSFFSDYSDDKIQPVEDYDNSFDLLNVKKEDKADTDANEDSN